MKPDRKTKYCPFCSEEILADAIKCRYCKEFLNEPEDELPVSRHAVQTPSPAPSREEREDVITPLLKRPVPAPTEHKKVPDLHLTVVPSVFGLLGEAFVALLLLVGAVALMVLPFDRWIVSLFQLSEEAAGNVNLPVQIIHLVGFVAAVVVVLRLAFQIISLKSIRYDISADRIEWSRGILNRKIDNIDMFRVADLKLHRSLLDCLMGIGTVSLITKDQTDPIFQFKKIRAPRRLYDTIKTAALVADRKQGVIHLD